MSAPQVGRGTFIGRLVKSIHPGDFAEKTNILSDDKKDPIPDPAPIPTPIPGREEEEAKKKARRRTGKGRQQNILAGRLMAQRRGNILNTRLG